MKVNITTVAKKIQIILLAAILLTGYACNDDDDDDSLGKDTFTATLNGMNEVPPNNSAATGTATLTYNRDTKIFTVIVEYSGIDVTAGHIHKGAANVSGDVVFPFVTLTSPIGFSSLQLTDAEEKDLYDQLYYVNLHSALFPGGEIRGQLIKQ